MWSRLRTTESPASASRQPPWSTKFCGVDSSNGFDWGPVSQVFQENMLLTAEDEVPLPYARLRQFGYFPGLVAVHQPILEDVHKFAEFVAIWDCFNKSF